MTVVVQCLYCNKDVVLPKIEGLKYTRWPVLHEECGKSVKKKEVNNYGNQKRSN